MHKINKNFKEGAICFQGGQISPLPPKLNPGGIINTLLLLLFDRSYVYQNDEDMEKSKLFCLVLNDTYVDWF